MDPFDLQVLGLLSLVKVLNAAVRQLELALMYLDAPERQRGGAPGGMGEVLLRRGSGGGGTICFFTIFVLLSPINLLVFLLTWRAGQKRRGVVASAGADNV